MAPRSDDNGRDINVPKALAVSFRRQTQAWQPVPEVVTALTGEYELIGENHSKPVYRRRRTAYHGGRNDVLVYYWDDIDEVDAEDPGCWWFGTEIGGDKVWACLPGTAAVPPERGWEMAKGRSANVELIVAQRWPSNGRDRVHSPEAPRRGSRQRPRSRSGTRSPCPKAALRCKGRRGCPLQLLPQCRSGTTDSRRGSQLRHPSPSDSRDDSRDDSRGASSSRSPSTPRPRKCSPLRSSSWDARRDGGAAMAALPPSPPWRRPPTLRERGHSLDLANRQLDDDGLRRWLSDEGPAYLRRFGHGPLNDINLSRNSLTDEGVRYLVDFLVERRQSTLRLKLFENQLREPSAICQLIEDRVIGAGAAGGLCEIHLSHNNISAAALGRILESLRWRAASCGPFRPPVWLRAECNDGLEDFSHDLAETHREKGLKLCLQLGTRNSGCNIRWCRFGDDVHLRLRDKVQHAVYHTNNYRQGNSNACQPCHRERSRSSRRHPVSESPGSNVQVISSSPSPGWDEWRDDWQDDWQHAAGSGSGGHYDAPPWKCHSRQDGWNSGHDRWSWHDDGAQFRREDDWHGNNGASAVASRGGRVELADSQYDDDRLQKWCEEEGPRELQRLGSGRLDAIDLSRNDITDEGVRLLVDLLRKHRQPTQRLKLFRNRLRDPDALCQLIEDEDLGAGAREGLSELHLSSNSITRDGLSRLLESLRRRHVACGGFRQPIWLRVERNAGIQQGSVEELAKEYTDKGLHICLEGGGPKSRCTIKYCRYDAQVHVHVEGGNCGASKPSWRD